jgi:hypothetical protein
VALATMARPAALVRIHGFLLAVAAAEVLAPEAAAARVLRLLGQYQPARRMSSGAEQGAVGAAVQLDLLEVSPAVAVAVGMLLLPVAQVARA